MTHRLRITHKDKLCIATAHGLITIEIGGRRNEFLVNIPDDLKMARSEERAFESSDFISSVEGRVVPKFDVLVPERRKDGALLRLEIQTVRRVATPVIRVVQTS